MATKATTRTRSEGQQHDNRGQRQPRERSGLQRRSFLQWLGAVVGIGGATQTASATQTGGGSAGLSATASGDGTQTEFQIGHDLPNTPTQVVVTPTTEDAMANFYVSDITNTEFTLTYAGAPPSGYMNLSWDATLYW